MHALSSEEARRWCVDNRVGLNRRGLPDLPPSAARFEIPVDAQKRVYLVTSRMRAFANEPAVLIWFDDWSVWPSGQRMHVFERFRLSYGEARCLIDSPGHLFAQSQCEDATSFVTLAVLFLWDCYAITPACGKLLFFSHDEYGLSHGVDLDSLDDKRPDRVH
jgi:hypothetical protein